MTSFQNESAVDAATKRDVIEEFHGALIQHGPLNQRFYFMAQQDAAVSNLFSPSPL